MAEEEIDKQKNFIGGLIHGTFLRVSVRLADIDLILPAFVSSITGSKFLIALLPSIYLSAGNLPQTLFANFVEPRARKKPFLYIAILSRVFIWFLMGLFVMTVGVSRPVILLSLLFFSLLVYSMTGSLGGVAYTDIIGKSIPDSSRARFYASRQVTGSLLAFGAGFLVRYVLGDSFSLGFPNNYGILFLLSAGALLVGVLGFYLIEEPRGESRERTPITSYFPGIIATLKNDRELRIFLMVRIVAGFHIMIIPYYIVFFKETVGIAGGLIGIYLAARVFGGALSNIAWGSLAEKNSNLVILLCLSLGAITPIVALLITNAGAVYFSVVFVLAGAGMNAREVGFNTQLLEIAPSDKRATYTGLLGTAIAITAPLPFLAGGLIEFFSFQVAFLFASGIMVLGLIALGYDMWRDAFADG
ncbi:MFS transporter [Candidatus Bipolaricaulota bacterium]|nr:MFS transporter [Candidatus Bipolaricaulota bacterium]